MFHARSLSSGQMQKQDNSMHPSSCQTRHDTLFLTRQKDYRAAQDTERVSIMWSNSSCATTWCMHWACLTALGKWSATLTLASRLQICRQTLEQAATPAELARFSLQINKPSAQKADIGEVGMGLNKAAEPTQACCWLDKHNHVPWEEMEWYLGLGGVLYWAFRRSCLSPCHRISTANLSGYYCILRLHCVQAQYFSLLRLRRFLI